MTTFTASIETNKGTYQHHYHLGTIEQVARDVAETLIKAEWHPKLGNIVVRTVGLLLDGKLVDVWDGEWSSVATDRMFAEEAAW